LSIKARLKIVVYIIIVVISVLAVRLYFLQVMSGEIYAQEASESIMRSKTIPAERGNIYDRNGKLLVKSIPAPSVAVDPRIVLSNEETIGTLSRILGMQKSEIVTKLQKNDISYLDRVILKQGIDYGSMIYIKEHSSDLPGVEVIDTFLREYEYGNLAAHILGYTGEIDQERLSSGRYSVGYEGGDQIGLTGIEDTYEEVLKGIKGKIVYEVDPAGKPKQVLEETPYIPGNDLYLTIDIDLQKIVEEVLASSIAGLREVKVPKSDENYKVSGGSVVVMDPKNGEVLAMASYPTYDPALFTGGISTADWKYLNDPENEFPLNNRAIMGYPAGSVFKLVTAYAGLNEEIINDKTYINCGGVWHGLGNDFPKWCWSKSGHGSLNIYGALQNSCDIFFYNVGYGLFMKNNNSDELLQKYTRLFGFGSRTGIDIPNEDSGVVPDKAWKKEYFKGQTGNTVWYPGDTVNMAIGQGDVLTTPLQMACAYSVLINRGIKIPPHFGLYVKDYQDNMVANKDEMNNQNQYVNLDLNNQYCEMIEKGMKQVVAQGTAAGKFLGFPLDKISVAGKTGTAEVAGKQDFAWFACYAPVDNPQYVMVVMLEQAGGGSSSAAPIARKILDYLFKTGK
jgi:penicillin-binding protein 2